MVISVTVIPANDNSNEEVIPQYVDINHVDEKYTVDENIIKLEDYIIREKYELNTHGELHDKPKPTGNTKYLIIC